MSKKRTDSKHKRLKHTGLKDALIKAGLKAKPKPKRNITKSESLKRNQRRVQHLSRRREPSIATPHKNYSIRPLEGEKKTSPKKPEPQRVITFTPDTKLANSLFREDTIGIFSSAQTPCGQSAPSASDKHTTQLIIGLDFGTSYTKVVIREPGSNRAWAVPFSEDRRNRYLLQSRIVKSKGIYRLSGDNGEVYARLKYNLMNHTESPQARIHATAFIALLLAHSITWWLHHHAHAIRGLTPEWLLNVGLPAADFRNHNLVACYRTVSLAGLLAAHKILSRPLEITESTLEKAVFSASISRDNETITFPGSAVTITPDQIDLFPEVMAQTYGLIKSDRWDDNVPELMLVDVGGTTLDCNIFNVIREGSTVRFSVFSSTVIKYGAFVLHLKRLDWIKRQALENGNPSLRSLIEEADNLLKQTESCLIIPDSINDYLINATFPEYTIEDRINEELIDKIIYGQLKATLDNYLGTTNRRNSFPFILCGGGATCRFFRETFSPEGYESHNFGIQPTRLEVPSDITESFLAPDEYHRLSVAYGLSYENLGEFIRPESIEPNPIPQHGIDNRDMFIDKSLV